MNSASVKLLHIFPAYYDSTDLTFEKIASWGGGERYAAELALATSRLTPTTLVTFGTDNVTFQEGDLRIVVLKSKPRLKKYNGNTEFISLSLMKMLKDFDVIHAHQRFTDTTVYAAILVALYRKKVFSTDHGFTGANVARFLPLDRLITRLLCQTEYDIKRLNLAADKLRIVGGGVDLAKYTYSKKKQPKVLFVGRLLPHKGVDYLIEALQPNQHCVIAGHPYNDHYFSYLKQKATDKRVEFLLSASDEEIGKHLKEASALVLPSVDIDYMGKKHKNPELFGLVVAEAFACGTPAIVSDSSALPYVVQDGVDGFVVPQNNAAAIREKVGYLLARPKVVIKMGAAARKKAEQYYNWNAVAQACMRYYTN